MANFNAIEIFTKANEDVTDEIDRVMNNYAHLFGIETIEQEAMFYAQLLAEVGRGATLKRENMNYSSKALKRVFKAFRKKPHLAEKYGRNKNHKANQVAIANIAYGGRNGNDTKMDGWNFRGGGLIQLTFKNNYIKVNDEIIDKTDIDFMLYKFPQVISTTTGAIFSALGFWSLNKIYECNTPNCATKKVNRYTDSYKKREDYYNQLIG